MELLDSGTRRTFATGAVRDVAEGKGRCDLLPLTDIGIIFHDDILTHIGSYIQTGASESIKKAIELFIEKRYKNDFYTAILEVAIHFEDGAKKYADRNWEKGMPLHCFIDSGVRHYLKFMRGDSDEPHDRAFLWNLLCALWMFRNRPDQNDLPFEIV